VACGAALCEELVAVDLSKGVMSADQIQTFFALAMGFAFGGLIASGYQLATRRPASFRLLHQGPGAATFAAVPLLVFAAPFIIMRNTIRGSRIEDREFSMVMLGTIVAGGWSLMSGSVVVMALTSLGIAAG
jgi:hypothetical protein